MKKYDVAIIGAGIVGLANAWRAAERDLSVAVFERTARAEGASIRNFGMIWPIGQSAGELYQTSLRSRELWQELGQQGVLEVENCGSIHLAHQPDELSLLEEFVGQGTHQSSMITPAEVLQKSDIANGDGLLGGMDSPTELRVDPRTASARVAAWLAETKGVDFYFNTPVTRVEGGRVHTANGPLVEAERALVCSGSDFVSLYPDRFEASGLVLCKLQMLKTSGQSRSLPGPAPHIASGLTLRHYTSFRNCPSLEKLKARIQAESPELDRFGIHVMASHFPGGDVILGDSHEYGDEISPFDKTEIDDWMIRELRKIVRLDDWNIREKWHGIYAKHPELPVFQQKVDERVTLFVGAGGAGMTMSFGLADRYWNQNG
ncbi:MAG: TIGR03364 family FAD-dependent oxidoreductase [Planctomycetota bacterium]|nr:TIGR03364 family FAD-dependent oxidoreductase [Planctomycetota bacterium]